LLGDAVAQPLARSQYQGALARKSEVHCSYPPTSITAGYVNQMAARGKEAFVFEPSVEGGTGQLAAAISSGGGTMP
jgi:hypothetical protein